MDKKQIPHGPEDQNCPYTGKSMKKVCHMCPKWMRITGMDPQDHTKTWDRWDCSDAFVPGLLIELGRQMRSVAAAVETLNKEVQTSNKDKDAAISTMLTVVNRSMDMVHQHAPAVMLNGANGSAKALT